MEGFIDMKSRCRRFIPVFIVILIIAAIVVKLNYIEKVPLISREGQTFEKGVVTEIIQDNIQPDGSRAGEQLVVVHMNSGERKGEDIQMTSSSGFLFGAPCKIGMKVIVMQSIAGESTVSAVYSRDRTNTIIIFALLYLALLCIVGGKKGLKGALGLIFTFASIFYIYLPLIYRGYSPFAVSVFICIITSLITFWLICGISKKAVSSALGTVSGVVSAGITAYIFSLSTGITGWNVSDIESLMTLWNTADIQVGGLLFSGLLISSLGATMDVAMSISSSMFEIMTKTPDISPKELFKSGMHIGRDMMGTDSNTLILAFAGSSISMIVLDYAYDLPLMQVINSNNIGIAVMQGLAGSFGIVLSVPATVFIATIIYTKNTTNL